MTAGQPGRASGAVSGLLAVALAVLVLGPALGVGYVLSYDMVFVPRQSLLPASLGLGGALPRAVPQDAVVALATVLAPGWVWQHLVLLAVVVVGALGAARLLRGLPWLYRGAAALLFVWSAYVAERLVLGAWALLLAYALLPWVVAAAVRVRRGVAAVPALLLLTALGSLVPTGGLLVALTGVPIAVGPGSRLSTRRRWALAAGVALLQAPWVVPALVHPAATGDDPAGLRVFALRSEGPWGTVLTALGTGGVWNGDAVPGSRTTWIAPAVAVVIAALALVGLRPLRDLLGRAAVVWLCLLAAGGFAVALLASWSLTGATVSEVLVQVPGAGLLRDGQKLLAPLALLLAVAAPLGLARAGSRWRDPAVGGVLMAGLALLPVATMPDLAWGVSGRLQAVAYPDDWQRVRDTVAAAPSGDVAVLPWSAFRAFAWNARRTTLDPAPRALPSPSVVDDSLLVGRADGTVVRVGGEDPRSAAVSAALAAGEPLARVLPGLGVGWLLVEKDTPGPVPTDATTGLTRIVDGKDLALWSVPGPAPIAALPLSRVVPVVAADAAAVLLVLAAALAWARSRRSSARRVADPLAVARVTASRPEEEA